MGPLPSRRLSTDGNDGNSLGVFCRLLVIGQTEDGERDIQMNGRRDLRLSVLKPVPSRIADGDAEESLAVSQIELLQPRLSDCWFSIYF